MPDILNNFKLDFLGVITLYGGDAALIAIRHCVLERRCSIYLSPGMFFVGTKLLKRTNNFLSKALAPGPRDNCSEVVGLLSTGKFRYTGIFSGARATVGNSVGEAVLNYTGRRSNGQTDEKSETTRVVAIYEDKKTETPEDHEKTSPIKRSSNYWDVILSIITLGTFVYVVLRKDIVGALIIIAGAVTNMLLTYAATASGCSYPSIKVSKDSPPGNAIVRSDSFPNLLWIVLGNEEFVQRILWHPITVELDDFWQSMDLLAGISVYVYTIFSILALPFVTISVQMIIAGLLILGFLTNVTYASRGDEFLIRTAERDIHVVYGKVHEFSSGAKAEDYCDLLSDLWKKSFTTTKVPSNDGIEEWKESLDENKRKKFDENEAALEEILIGDITAIKEKTVKDSDHHIIIEDH